MIWGENPLFWETSISIYLVLATTSTFAKIQPVNQQLPTFVGFPKLILTKVWWHPPQIFFAHKNGTQGWWYQLLMFIHFFHLCFFGDLLNISNAILYIIDIWMKIHKILQHGIFSHERPLTMGEFILWRGHQSGIHGSVTSFQSQICFCKRTEAEFTTNSCLDTDLFRVCFVCFFPSFCKRLWVVIPWRHFNGPAIGNIWPTSEETVSSCPVANTKAVGERITGPSQS